MADKRIKVKALAAELGVPARSVIEFCQANGHAVQNSVTKLAPDVERAVREEFRSKST